jgi:16S rRNA (guanine(527)-N(7))-methyltransferase RsmG
VKHAGDPTDIEAAARAPLERYAALLLRWNRRVNLISRADEPTLWLRHILDSAQLVPLLPTTPGTLVDLGSGAGFPGLVLAVLTLWRVHLVESDQRKAAFLREAARGAGAANVTVHAARAEAVRLPPADVVTARALAPVAALLPLAKPLLADQGVCLFPKGRDVEAELTEAGARWHMRVERFPSRTSPGATLLRISEIRRAG